ncbi:MAG: penicillin-binding protein activator [Ectothiorhodospira sp.]
MPLPPRTAAQPPRIPRRIPRSLLSAGWLILLLIGGCAGLDPAPSTDEVPPDEARALVEAGDPVGAARLYLEAADQARGERKAQLQLEALDLLTRNDVGESAWQRAETLARELDERRLGEVGRNRFSVFRARLALYQGNPESALEHLPDDPESWAAPLDHQALEIRGQARWDTGQWSGAIEDLAAVAAGREEAVPTAAEALWERLSKAPAKTLDELDTDTLSSDAAGWVRLARLARKPIPSHQALMDWQQAHPGHAAHPAITGRVATLWALPGRRPQQVAVLLPLTGEMGAAGQTILEGITAAYFDTPEERRPRLEIHDTAGDPDTAREHYRDAVDAGVDWVVGPLSRTAVEELSEQERLPVPTLALNHAPGDGPFPEALYQFGLNPEEEARQVAERAILDGLWQAVILAPDSPLGARLHHAFEARFTELGGVVRETGYYAPDDTDFETLITETLRIRPAPERKKGEGEDEKPRHRSDVDLIFLGASAAQARQIRPQLRYHHAGELPVMATSRIHTTRPDPRKDADLDGILFADIPWVLEGANPRPNLRQQLARTGPEGVEQLPRLVALGFDALRILPRLGQLSQGTGTGYDGLTGRLHVDPQRRVLRTLNWARFIEGRPRLLQGGESPLEDTPQ